MSRNKMQNSKFFGTNTFKHICISTHNRYLTVKFNRISTIHSRYVIVFNGTLLKFKNDSKCLL